MRLQITRKKQCRFSSAKAEARWEVRQDEQFEALYNELQASGNKEKLMQIFGH